MANINIKVGYTIDKASLNEITKQLSSIRIQAKTADALGKITPELKEASKAATQLENILNSAWNSKINQLDLSKVNNGIKNTYGNVQNLQKALVKSGNDGATAYNNFAMQVLNTNNQLKQTSSTLDKMAVTLKNTIRYGISSSVFNTFTNSIQKAFNYSKQLDTSLNDIRIVTEKSADEMDRFAVKANQVAKELGRSTKDFTEASLIYYQQGLGNKEAQARAEVTMKAANVTGQTGKDVSEQLTAVWNGYKVTADEAELYVDKLAAVAAGTAADLEELSVGMGKVASAANIMGVDIDQLNAQLATVVSVTRQAPESVGTAFKTIYARMGDIKAGLDDEITLGTYTEKMAQYGVNVLDANNNLRDMGDVIEEIGNKWTTLSREQQVALSQTMAGTRQYNNLLSLFDNWDMYIDALKMSADAAGTLQKQQDIYMESTEAHLRQLSTEAEKTYNILFDKDAVNTMTDALTELLSIFNNLLAGLGGGLKDFAFFGTTVANIFNKQIGTSIERQIENLEAMRANINKEELQRQIIATHAARGENVTNASALEMEIPLVEKTLDLQKYLTAEQAQQLNNEIAKVGLLEQQIQGILHYRDIAEKYNVELSDSYDDLQENFRKSIENEKEKLQIEKERKRDLEESLAIYQEEREIKVNRDLAIDSIETMTKYNKENVELKEIINTINGKNELSEEQIQVLLKLQNQTEKEIINNIKELENGLQGVKDDEEYIVSELEEERDLRKSGIESDLSKRERQKAISETIQGLTAVFSLLISINGIIETINDDTISTEEKTKRIITTLLTNLPILLMNLSAIAKMIPNITIATNSLAIAMGASGVTASSGFLASLVGIISIAGPYVIAIGLIAAAIYTIYKEVNKYTDAVKNAKEATQKLTDEYNELKDTISEYKNAKESIDKLTEGTVEFYDAILKSNEAAQKLIDSLGLLANVDYTIDKNGLININSDILEKEQFKKQQELYRSSANVNLAEANLERNALNKIVKDFMNEVNWAAVRTGAKIDETQAKRILEGKDGQLGDLKGNFLEALKESPIGKLDKYPDKIINNANKNSDKLVKATKENSIDIQSAINKYLSQYKSQQAKINSLEEQQSANLIRGYGNKQLVEQYNNLTKAQQESVNKIVTKERKLNEQDLEVKESSKLEKLFLSGSLASLLNAKSEENKKLAKEEYAKNALGYQQINGIWYDENLKVVDYNKIQKEVDTSTAVSAYNSGEYTVPKTTEEVISKIKDIKQQAYELGANETSQNYIAEAMLAKETGNKDYDFSLLTAKERQIQTVLETSQKNNLSTSVVENPFWSNLPDSIKNLSIEDEDTKSPARLTEDLSRYNEELAKQAEALDTSIEALNSYAYAMEKAGDLTNEKTKETAEAIAQEYSFNKAYNKAADTFEKSSDAYEEYINALKNGEKVSYDIADQVGELSKQLKEMFGMDISPKVLEENYDDIKTMLSGTADEAEEAYNRIQQAAIKDALVNSLNFTEADAEGLMNAINNLDPGGVLDDNWSAALIKMIEDAQLTTSEVENLFNNMHLEMPEIETPDIETEEGMFETSGTTTKHEFKGQMPTGEIDPSTGNAKTVPIDYYYMETVYPKKEPYVKFKDQNVNFKKISGGGSKNFARPSSGSSGKSSGGGGGGGSGTVKEPDKMDPLEKEVDRYHDVDVQLDLISNDLDKLEKQKKKLFGKDLINNVNKQLNLLNKQINTTNEKIKIAQGEVQELKEKLSGQGTVFNADGTIGNYADVYNSQLSYVNELIDQYNNMDAEAQEGFKETVEQAKKDFDKFTSDLSRYDELITDTIPGLKEDIQSAIDEKIDLQIEKFDMEIEIRLNLAEAERDWNDFKKKIIDGIEDDDILGNAMARLIDFSSYYKEDDTGVIQALRKQVDNTLAELNQMDTKGWSSVYGDNRTAALEDLQKYYKDLMNNLEDVLNLQKEIHKSYISMMDEAQEKFDEQIKSYEMITDLIDHDMKVISLIYGEESYSQLAKYYDKQQQNFNNQLDFQRQQVDFWRQQLNSLEEGSDAWENAKEKWANAVEELNSLIEDSIQNLQDKYLNAINLIFQNLNNKVTDGLGLNYIEEEWTLINKNADQYLDTINSLYETQKLENKYLDAIDKTDSISAQRQLKKIMDEELADLRERDKLTEYDIERANKKYEIALKQIALQEAQQNKSKMRLRRDSQGNYRYEYTADEDQVGQLQDELNDMYNSLYNFDKARYQDNLSQLYDIWVEFQEKMAEAAQINDPELRAEKELLLQEQYGELINGLTEQNITVRNNLNESAFDDLARLYDTDVSNFQNMSEAEKETLMGDLVPYWESGVQHMAEVFAGEGGFLGVCQNAFEQLHNATKDYENGLYELEDTGRISFEDIKNGIDGNIEGTRELIADNRELIGAYEQELNAIGSVIEQLDYLISQYNSAREAAIAATTAAYNYWSEQQRQAADAASEENNGSAGNNSSVDNSISDLNENGVGDGDGNLTVGETATFDGQYYYDSYGTTPIGSKYSGIADGIVVDRITDNPYGIHIHSADGKYPDLGWIKKSQLSGYDTGGYTGTWGNEGKIALLHQKELVLNKEDTANMLNAINIMRNITNMLGSSVLNKLAAATAGNFGGNVGNDILEQNVHIDAQFPNVKDAREIEDALNNLVNMASMRANRK